MKILGSRIAVGWYVDTDINEPDSCAYSLVFVREEVGETMEQALERAKEQVRLEIEKKEAELERNKSRRS